MASTSSAVGRLVTKFTIPNSAKNNVIKNSDVESTLNSEMKSLLGYQNDVTDKTFNFNASEAEKARNWQEMMSDTSHQREVDDLKRAGLNPVLSSNSGATAYGASSASGSADSSAIGAIASLYQNKMNNDNAVKIARLQNENNLKIAQLGNKNAKEVAKINAAASNYASNNAYSASRYASDNSYNASLYSTDQNNSAKRYSADQGLKGTKYGSAWTLGDKIKNFYNSWKKK